MRYDSTVMARELTRQQEIERSIFKKYKSTLWAPFLSAVNQYELLKEGDRVAVCISGGKDSMLMAKLFQLLQRHSSYPFELVFLMMDPGYSPAHRKQIEDNAATLGIPLTVFETNIFLVSDTISRKPCYLCARMRRGHLYNKARELNCNKIALGHHMNDAIETTVMSMFWSSKLETIIPKSNSENFEGMELIRPMYRTKEDDILSWCAYNDLHFIQCACSFTERMAQDDSELTSKRRETKLLLKELKKNNPDIEENIFRALHAVQIESFPGYKANHAMHSFLENYPNHGRLITKTGDAEESD